MGAVQGDTPTVGEIDRLKTAYGLTHAEAEDVGLALIETRDHPVPDTPWNAKILDELEEVRARQARAEDVRRQATAALADCEQEIRRLERQLSRTDERDLAAAVIARRTV